MELIAKKGALVKQQNSVIILPLQEAGKGETIKLSGRALEIDKEVGGKISSIIAAGEFSGKKGEMTILHTFKEIAPERILLAGLGKAKKLSFEGLRNLIGSAARVVRKSKGATCAVSIDDIPTDNFTTGQAARAVAEGFILGLYRLVDYKTKNRDQYDSKPNQLIILSEDDAALKEVESAIKVGQVIADNVCISRNLSNHPSNYITPTKLAQTAKELAKDVEIECTILEQTDVEKMGMGSFLSVAKGSIEPLKLIKMEYKPDNHINKKPIVLVGKAITFDSGGLSLKGSENMHQMKDDMSGGGAVITATHAIAKLKLPVHVISIVPSCENMPSGSASKPGDIVKTMSGKTIEIQNTDAEGRLILADAVYYGSTFNPEVIIDIATLTGACVIALGDITTGLLGNSSRFIEAIKLSAKSSGDKVWELPMFEEYHELMESDFADVRNIGGRKGSTITAAKFLENFVDDADWIHLDIAGTSWSDKESGYITKGATGSGVALLTQFVIDYAK